MKRKKIVVKKPSRLDDIQRMARTGHLHLSSYEIGCRLTALYADKNEREQEIEQLTARVKELRNRVAGDQAEITGIESIVNERSN